ncbi:ion transporter [Alteromonas sediminis]|uniref:Ion transporter n=1 Tax=Alteromonas sediminis TaxID=2259342 RepID=A0A3N5Y1Q0_9ALTE|nr:ion transporter [Alteromonas sediminis]RPJ66486.1 ion transporter [Alteromonas sediminis]
MASGWLAARKRVSELLEPQQRNDKLGDLVDFLLVVLIVTNVLAVMASTVNSIDAQYGQWLFAYEVFSVGIFTIEYVLRVWSSVEHENPALPKWKARLSYATSPMAVIDLLAILPFYLSLFFNLDLRFLRIIRLIRVAKLGRYSGAMQLLYDVFRREFKVLTAALLWLVVLMVIASSGIYLIEHQVQPDKFGSIPQAMWWAMATLTTVGYGDVTPITPLGKFFGGTITVISMAMVALPAGILASSFSEQLRKRRDTFSAKVIEAFADGVLSAKELHELEKLRKTLGLERQDAEALFNLIQKERTTKLVKTCPHCGKSVEGHE